MPRIEKKYKHGAELYAPEPKPKVKPLIDRDLEMQQSNHKLLRDLPADVSVVSSKNQVAESLVQFLGKLLIFLAAGVLILLFLRDFLGIGHHVG